jgi:hypothetical protein
VGRIVIAALLMLVAGDNAIADDQRFGPSIQELQPSLTCAGILITTTDKNTSDEAVRDFSVVVSILARPERQPSGYPKAS